MTYLPVYAAVTARVVLALDAAWAVLRYATSGQAPRPYNAVTDRVEAWRDDRRPRPEPVPVPVLAAQLRRLSDQVQRISDSDRPAKALHLRAALLAYDDGLLRACSELGVRPPAGASRGMSREQRFSTESALLASGFAW
ncbi:hypothetical protein [Knoellia sp. LjRoot47]|uniref:hypothetical protein n=1 Tax=Knoellia sp. LjRoot47 TaxID=3342330 RepID=UPI003ECD779D